MLKRTLHTQLVGAALFALAAASQAADVASAVSAAPAALADAPLGQLSAIPNAVARLEALQAALESFDSLALKAVDRSQPPANALPEKPVVVALTKATEDKPPLKAFGQDVVYLTREQIREQQLVNFVKVDSVELKSDTLAEVKLIYPYRALGGTVLLNKTATGWQVNKDNVAFSTSGAQMFYQLLFDGMSCRDDTEYARWKNSFHGVRSGKCEGERPQAAASQADAKPAAASNKAGKKKRKQRSQ